MNVYFPGFRRAFVIGCAEFIGSNLADRLLAAGIKVVGYDDLSTGMVEVLATAQRNSRFTFVRGDVLDERMLRRAMAGADVVFHFAANAEFGSGSNICARTSIRIRSRRSTCLRRCGRWCEGHLFSLRPARSTATPTLSRPRRTHPSGSDLLYGASKLAGEGLIERLLRRLRHASLDLSALFPSSASATPTATCSISTSSCFPPGAARVLVDGHQRKSSLYVQDCIDPKFHAVIHSRDK